MTESNIPKSGIYKHFKGNLYLVIGVANYSEDPDQLFVVYVPLYSCPQKMWVRPLSSWNELVEKPDYMGPRFSLVFPDADPNHVLGYTKAKYDNHGEVDWITEITGYHIQEGELFVNTKTIFPAKNGVEEYSRSGSRLYDRVVI